MIKDIATYVFESLAYSCYLHLSTKGYSIYSIYFTTCRLRTWYNSSKPIGCALGASTNVRDPIYFVLAPSYLFIHLLFIY